MGFDWAGFLFYVFLQTFTPGPNTLSTLANSSRVGVRRNMPFACGIVTGVIGILFACGIVYERIHQWLPQIKPVMLGAGAAYLLWLAWKTYRTDFSKKQNSALKGNTFWDGIALEFVNPKLFLYSLTIMSKYVVGASYNTPGAIAGFSLIVGGICFLSLISYALFGALILKALLRYGKFVNVALSLSLVYCVVMLFR